MRTTLCFDFARASVLALCLVFTVPAAIAQGGGEQGSSNGRPFTSVLEQLQAEIAAIEAAQQNELECIKD